MTNTVRTTLGPADAFRELPAPITLGSRKYFLVGDDSGYRLLSAACPHQGGTVFDEGTRFECPIHNWRFDRATGRCLNAPSRALASITVVVEHDVLYVDMPREMHADPVRQGARLSKRGLTVQLHAHACLEITYEGVTLLTDPWLDGPAFLGSWAPYPPPMVRGSELRPDAILITHEHSDHFHEPTLRHFDRRTPIYVPDFPNQRLQRRLAKMEFTDVRVMRFGEPSGLAVGWSVTAFEPDSYWNDAMVLIDIDGFRVFNINDAGINARIARIVGPVDVLAVQFSAGASGYPWTWAHFSEAQKSATSEQACNGKLKLIREAAGMYQTSSVLPFASYFTLWHPSHRSYASMMKRNTLEDVTVAMADSPVEVIDLLPGDAWDVGRGLIRRGREDAHTLFDPARVAVYMDHAVDERLFAAYHPSDESLTADELTAYLLRLNAVPEIVLCENLSVRIQGEPSGAGRRSVDFAFALNAGRVRILADPPAQPNLTIAMPLGILTSIVRQDLSWDEAFIGYWCRFDRFSNVYHAGFWRLLQAPYYRKPVSLEPLTVASHIDRQSTVAEVLEACGSEADRILRRYGLYCSGCHHSTTESIDLAARQHGVEARRVDLLVKELNRAFFDAETPGRDHE